MLIFWKCGIVSTVPTGVNVDRDDPRILAARNIPDTKAATAETAAKTAIGAGRAVETADAERTIKTVAERMTGENNENHTYIAQ